THTLHRNHPDHHHYQTTLTTLHTHHHQPTHHKTNPRPTTKLPTYPFQRTTHWLTPLTEEEPLPDDTPLDAESLLTLVRAHVAVIAGTDGPRAVDKTRTFKQLGFDSLAAVELHGRLSAATGLRLPTSLTFDHPTPEAVAAELETRLSAATHETLSLAPLLDRLDGVRELLSGQELGESARETAAARLSELLALCADAGRARETAEDAPDLEAASDGEMFDFITNELGIS
ncbi:phosphopantetheine-binding protein, partial [Streptomyces sp. NPDC020141]|uniref:phosphopantetheine-binding protein n=1 Tax=Streptomyces sp. NPDC020141 TaxID=3365065 RepID=UPI0037AF3F7F